MKIELYIENELLEMLRTKPVSQIYVTNLIERVGVCKGTFYKYYCDKYDLVQKCFHNRCYAAIIERCETTKDFIRECLSAFREMPRVVLHAMETGEPNSLFNYHSKLLREFVVKDRIRTARPYEGKYYSNVIALFCDDVTRMTVGWLGGNPISQPEELMQLVRGIVPRALCE